MKHNSGRRPSRSIGDTNYNDDDKAGAVIWLVAALMATLFMMIAEA